MRQLDVLVADNHPIFAQGLQTVLSTPGKGFLFNVKGIAKSGTEVTDMLYENNPDLLLLDMSLLNSEGLKKLSDVKRKYVNTRILIMAGAEEPNILRDVFDSGADGFMLKSATKDELLTLIEQVVEGNTFWQTHQSNGNLTEDGNLELAFARKYGLTRRELEILQLIGEALDNRKIGDRLYISHQTVSVHRKNIMRKLGVNSTASLIKIAFENHLV